MDCNKQKLREVAALYPGKEARKILEGVYKKVSRHLCEEENMMGVVWRGVQGEFVRRIEAMEGLIGECYAGERLEFGVEDVLGWFSSIARAT